MWNNSVQNGGIFIKFDICEFFENLSIRVKVIMKGIYMKTCVNLYISQDSTSNEIRFKVKLQRKWKHMFYFQYFLFQNCFDYEIMWRTHTMPCCICTATIVTRTSNNYMLYRHCLSFSFHLSKFSHFFYTGLFISPSGNSEIDCATTKTDTAERSISIGRESLQDFFFCTRGLGVCPGSTARG